MTRERRLVQMLELVTRAPESRIESLPAEGGKQAKAVRRLLGERNVVALGISEKVTSGLPTGRLALTFYVEKKLPLKKLRADQLVPPLLREGFRGGRAVSTDVVALGRLRPEVNAMKRPIQPGNSIGHVNTSAGTLGALVRKGKTVHLLSNSHVFAQSGVAAVGDEIVYPGTADGGETPDDVVAALSDFTPFVTGGDFVNRADCAIAEPVPSRVGDLVADIRGLGTPTGAVKPRRGMHVIKVGRTTNKTEGVVRDVNFRFVLDYEEIGEVGFVDQVLCSRYTAPGDSGSLVLEKETRRAVGLHFAGADGGSVFSPIGGVLTSLGVKLVTAPLTSWKASKKRRRAPKSRRPRSGGARGEP